MKKWPIALVLVVVVIVGTVLAFTVFGDQQVTRVYPIAGVNEAQCGNSRVTVVFDGQDRIVLRTARRNLLWSMVRIDKSPKGRVVSFGYYDDADPRVLLGMFGSSNPGDDALVFEVHTGALERITVAGGATLSTDSLVTDDFAVASLTERPITLSGVDVDTLRIFMQAGDVTASGHANVLYLENSSDHGEFRGDGFTASNFKPNAEEALP